MDIERLEEIIKNDNIDNEDINEVERTIILMIIKRNNNKRYSKKLINFVFNGEKKNIELFNKLYEEYRYRQNKKKENDKIRNNRKKYNEYHSKYYYEKVKIKKEQKKKDNEKEIYLNYLSEKLIKEVFENLDN